MNILAVTAGRKNGNGEILVKEALMRAEELGAEVKMINLHDYNITPCSGCESCTVKFTQKHEPPECIYKDDMDKIMKEWLAADGVIVAVPAFSYMPAGIYRIFTDRHLAYEPNFHKQVGNKDYFKHRVGAIIGNGGSTRSWMSLTLECINITLITQDIKVVDQMMANRAPRPGQILLDEAALNRARQLGENVIKGIQDYENVKFLGDQNLGWCPVCHSNVLSLGQPHWNSEGFVIECPICHCGGDLQKDENGKWKFVIQENGDEKSMLDGRGAKDHFFEIEDTMKKYFMNLEKIDEKRKKYTDYKPASI
ncbi:multimeric flavodoxin WrbA [Anaerobacterium chartisolvens]|uniref:Multimeric flavodoxin WrbA n=1 Tax=Anaerobacterium chartisolvens TaxID=1297424 RepID=A0A369AP16_9FIRM|nr:flavodoxin family protein [Anaerobacterium chartisolvens]RCX09927.1 multimeric flavodoxin WrbA [Anaerobacterium chartisolvens]